MQAVLEEVKCEKADSEWAEDRCRQCCAVVHIPAGVFADRIGRRSERDLETPGLYISREGNPFCGRNCFDTYCDD